MTNLQSLLSIGIPSLLVLVSIALGTWAIKDLRTEIYQFRQEMIQRFDRVDTRLDRVDADLRTFYSITGKLEGRLDTLDKR